MNNDLISRSELKKAIEELAITEELVDYDCDDVSTTGVSQYLDRPDVLDAIDNAPTVSEITKEKLAIAYEQGYEDGKNNWLQEERPHGEWIRKCNEHRVDICCTNCGYDEGYSCFKYCPHCGAAMMKGDTE